MRIGDSEPEPLGGMRQCTDHAAAGRIVSLEEPAMSSPLAATGVMPSLTVNDMKQSVEFFTALGFVVEDPWEQDGVLLGAMLKAGQAHIGLSQDDGKKGRDRVKGVGMRLYIEVSDDVDAVAERAKAGGVRLAKEPYDTEWGTRAFEVVEPSGFLMTISSQSS
jgi:uncharacterized glyoxalase superfamily protein PhnB